MARAGILYSHVAQAATKLAAEGKNPTVDNVREALGSTGSKSTIAPFLRRWKSEHEDVVLAQDAGVPRELLQVIKGLYESLQQDAGKRVQEIAAGMEAASSQFAVQLDSASQAATALIKERENLLAQLALERGLREKLEGSNHLLQLACAKAEGNAEGLTQRLADRQTEVDNLHRQLDHVRAQFEHYQESIATQRSEERQLVEQRRTRFENEIAEVRRIISAQQTSLAQYEVQLTQAQQERGQAVSNFNVLKTEHLQVLSERNAMEQSLTMQITHAGELRIQLDSATAAYILASTDLAVLRNEKPQLQERIGILEKSLQELAEKNTHLMVNQARLEGLLSQINIPDPQTR